MLRINKIEVNSCWELETVNVALFQIKKNLQKCGDSFSILNLQLIVIWTYFRIYSHFMSHSTFSSLASLPGSSPAFQLYTKHWGSWLHHVCKSLEYDNNTDPFVHTTCNSTMVQDWDKHIGIVRNKGRWLPSHICLITSFWVFTGSSPELNIHRIALCLYTTCIFQLTTVWG